MNPLDIGIVAVAFILVVRSAYRGFVREIMSIAGVLGSSLVALLLYRPVTPLIEGILPNSGFAPIIAFLVIFIVAYILMKAFERGLHSLFSHLCLDGLDTALGLVLGLVEAIVLTCVVLLALRLQSFFDVKALLTGSVIAQAFLPLVAGYSMSDIQSTFDRARDAVLPSSSPLGKR